MDLLSLSHPNPFGFASLAAGKSRGGPRDTF
jgi:hypothetical protein